MLTLEHVTKIFGTAAPDALKRLDRGEPRDTIHEATGSLVAVADVSLEIRKGEILVLMGSSGSGKSTLLRCINGLVRPERGRVLLSEGDGAVDLVTADPEMLRRLRLRRVAMVFQRHACLPWRTVRDNVALGLEFRGMAAEQMRKVVTAELDRVGLRAWADAYPRELSGGMEQRVGLARALATDPDVLLLDEPLGALDPLIRVRMQDELLALQRELRKTMIFVTHDLDEALRLGSRIAVFEAGRVVQLGTPAEIVTSPRTPFVRQFVERANLLNGLRGAALMRPVAALVRDGVQEAVVLDHTGRCRCTLDGQGKLVSVLMDGAVARLKRCEEGRNDDLTELDIASGSPEMSIRALLRLCNKTGRPVLLLDPEDHLIGVIEEREIVRALLGSR